MSVWWSAVLHVHLLLSGNLLAVAQRAHKSAGGGGAAPASGASAASTRVKVRKAWASTRVKMGHKTECPRPVEESGPLLCEWLLCKHEHYKKKMQTTKKKVEEEFPTLPQDAQEAKLMSKLKTRANFFKATYYAVENGERDCPWAEDTLREFRVWTKDFIPTRYRCVLAAIDEHAESSKVCVEGFTHYFKWQLFTKCKDVDFFDPAPNPEHSHEDEVSTAFALAMDRYGRARAVIDMGVVAPGSDAPEVSGEVPPRVANEFSKDGLSHGMGMRLGGSLGATVGLGTGVALTGSAATSAVVATGAVLGQNAIYAAVQSTYFSMLWTWATGNLIVDITIPTAGIAIAAVLGVGILALTIAFLACFFAPGKKRSGGAPRFAARALSEGVRNRQLDPFRDAVLSEIRRNPFLVDDMEQAEGDEKD